MKKVILILCIMVFPFVVSGKTCEVKKDINFEDSRSLVCDLDKKTVTKFETNEPVKALENDVCTITCKEEVVFAVDPVKKVLAGMSFNYPLYASGVRKCTANYNYVAYENKIKDLVNKYHNASGSKKNTIKNEIVNLQEKKKACDDFTKTEEGNIYQNKYKFNENAKVKLKLYTSKDAKEFDYVFKDIEKEYDNSIEVDNINYNSCNLDPATYSCRGSEKTIVSWKETARIFGKYTLKDMYVDKHEGTIKNVADKTTCNAGDRFFVNFKEYSTPVTNDPKDLGYKIELTAANIGNNIVKKGDRWNLNVDCYYQVKNLIFPEGGINKTEDESYKKYGNTAFQYRVVDVNNPFPERAPGANWKGKEEIITSKPYKDLMSLERFVIELNRSKISRVREYNEELNNKYDTFNLDEMEKSQFIINNPEIVHRK